MSAASTSASSAQRDFRAFAARFRVSRRFGAGDPLNSAPVDLAMALTVSFQPWRPLVLLVFALVFTIVDRRSAGGDVTDGGAGWRAAADESDGEDDGEVVKHLWQRGGRAAGPMRD